MRKYIGWAMFGLLVLPATVGALTAFPVVMFMAVGGTILVFCWVWIAAGFVEGMSIKESWTDLKNRVRF